MNLASGQPDPPVDLGVPGTASIWLSDNVGDVVYRVPLHMK
jgi:hypothetical protein